MNNDDLSVWREERDDDELERLSGELDVLRNRITDALLELRSTLSENEALRRFAADVLESWPHGVVPGCELQEIAVKHGLLVPEQRFAPCSEYCNCAEFYASDEWADGITCYRRAPSIEAARSRT
jgi:hypothetical protein